MTSKLRLRAVLDRNRGFAVAALLACLLLGGWLTYGAYAAPGTHLEERPESEWTLSGSLSHGATVTGAANGTAFDPGERVSNRSVYFERLMPVLQGNLSLSATGTDVPVDVRINRSVTVRSVDAGGPAERSTVYWENRTALGATRVTLAPGERLRLPFRTNVTRALQRAENVSERLDSPGQPRVVVATTAVATRQAGDARPRQLRLTLSADDDGGVYRVRTEPVSQTFTETETVSVPNDPGPLREAGGPLLLVGGGAGLAGLGALAVLGRLGLTDRERAWLDYRTHRADYDEWVTTVRLPPEAERLPAGEAPTLADLVDVAIDTDSAVLESPDGDAYHVIDDGYRYTFEPPADPTDPGADDGSQDADPLDADATPPDTDANGAPTDGDGADLPTRLGALLGAEDGDRPEESTTADGGDRES
jgi:hypothetical protein